MARIEDCCVGPCEEIERRISPPWEGYVVKEKLREIPFEQRSWWFDCRNGSLTMHENSHDEETGQVNGVIGRWDNQAGEASLLSRDDVAEIFKIAEETDCTLAEATIEHIGEDRLSVEFVQKMLQAPKVRYRNSKAQVALRKQSQHIEFVSPRLKAKENPKPIPVELSSDQRQQRNMISAIQRTATHRKLTMDTVKERTITRFGKTIDEMTVIELKEVNRAITAGSL